MSQEEVYIETPSLEDALRSLRERLQKRENPNIRELELLNTFIINADFIQGKANEDAEDVEPGYFAQNTYELEQLSLEQDNDGNSDEKIKLMEGLLNEFRELGITLPSERGERS